MAHLIEFNHGKASMAWAGETPWHGLGTQVSNDLTPQEMMEAAGVNWEVATINSFIRLPNGQEVDTGDAALVRLSDNKILDNVSSDWIPNQNATAFEFFNEFVAAGDMEMHTAGSLKGGQIVWAMAKVKDGFTLANGDTVESHLLFTNPHKYGQAIDVRFTPVRVVCNNTLSLAISQKVKDRVRFGHRKEFDATKAKDMLNVIHGQLENYKQAAEFLCTKRWNDEMLTKYFGDVFPVYKTKAETKKELSKNAVTALEIVGKQPGFEYGEGSWWQAFNAVTFMTNHVIGETSDSRVNGLFFGTSANTNVDALKLALEYAKAA